MDGLNADAVPAESGAACDISDEDDFHHTARGVAVTESYHASLQSASATESSHTALQSSSCAAEGKTKPSLALLLAAEGKLDYFLDVAPGSADASRFQSEASYPLSKIESLRAQPSMRKAERPMDWADKLGSTWAYKSKASIVGSIAGRYDCAIPQEGDLYGSIISAKQDRQLLHRSPTSARHLGPSRKKLLWRSATAAPTLFARLRGGDGGSADTKKDSGSKENIIRRSFMTLQKPASQKRRNWNPFRAVGKSDLPDGDASNAGRPSYIPYRASIFRNKIRVLNARTLFKILQVNIFRLQLCIPLNYLEQLALDADDSLHASAAAVTGVDADAGQVHSSPQAVTEAITGLAIDSISHKGNAGGQRQSGSVDLGKSQSLLSRWKSSSKGISSMLKTSISVKELKRHQSSRKSLSALIARQMEAERTNDEGDADADVGQCRVQHHGGKLSELNNRSSDKKWQKRHLPVERMLGTAIVQAFLSMNAVLSKEDLNTQTIQASQLPWQMPRDRPFSWYVDTFKVLIDSIRTVGWYQRSHLWNLIFLQRSDGSYKMTIYLATMLKSGRPLDDLMTNPVAPFDPVVLEESMPSQLLVALSLDETVSSRSNSSAPTLHDSSGSSYTVARDVWATLLVVQRLRRFPFTWIENPNDPTWRHVTIQNKSEQYIARQCQEYPDLQGCLPDLEDIAGEYIHKWTEDHEKRIADLYASQQLSQKELECRTQSFWQRFGRIANPDTQSTKRAKSLGTSFKRFVIRVVKAHPLTAICMVTATEPFTRSDRILVQANTFIFMLLFAVWLFYSKAVNCCRELRTRLSCPSNSDIHVPCLGFPTCAALVVWEQADGEPEELTMERGNFLCTAFPQSTYADRIWTVLIMIGILTPVTIMLSSLFIMHANASIPKNWEIRQVPKKSVAGLGTTTAALQTVLLTMYAIFFKFEKMNKAIAVTFVAIFKVIINTIIATSARVHAALASSLYCWWTLGAASKNISKSRFRGPQGVTSPGELNEVGFLLRANMQRVAYFIIAVLWLTIAWMLITYAMLLGDMMSAEAQNDFFAMWAIAFGLGLFGAETVQIILIQTFANIVGERIHTLFADIDPSMLWFEKFVISKMSSEDAEMDDENQNDDDAGDQDMGDDADAFGGDGEAMQDAN